MGLVTSLAVPAEPSMPAHFYRAPPIPSHDCQMLEAPIQHPFDRALCDAEIACAETL